MEKKRSQMVLTTLIAAAVLVIILAIAGVVRNPGASGSTGTIIFDGLKPSDKVFVDNELESRERIGADEEVFVPAGNRDILVSKGGAWPWLKQIKVPAGGSVTLSPFLFPQQPVKDEVTGDDPEYEALVSLIAKAQLPTASRTQSSPDKSVAIWADANQLVARWIGNGTPSEFLCITDCGSDIVFLRSANPIRAVSFWRARNDVVIVASGTDVYGLELDRRPVQNFQPIYQGTAPSFALTQTGELYIKDGSHLYHISIDD